MNSAETIGNIPPIYQPLHHALQASLSDPSFRRYFQPNYKTLDQHESDQQSQIPLIEIASLYAANIKFWEIIDNCSQCKNKMLIFEVIQNLQYLDENFEDDHEIKYLENWVLLCLMISYLKIGNTSIAKGYFKRWEKNLNLIDQQSNKLNVEQYLGYLGSFEKIDTFLEVIAKNCSNSPRKIGQIKQYKQKVQSILRNQPSYLPVQTIFDQIKKQIIIYNFLTKKCWRSNQDKIDFFHNKWQLQKTMTPNMVFSTIKVVSAIYHPSLFREWVHALTEPKRRNKILQFQQTQRIDHFLYKFTPKLEIVRSPKKVYQQHLQNLIFNTNEVKSNKYGPAYLDHLLHDPTEEITFAPLKQVYQKLYRLRIFWVRIKQKVEMVQKASMNEKERKKIKQHHTLQFLKRNLCICIRQIQRPQEIEQIGEDEQDLSQYLICCDEDLDEIKKWKPQILANLKECVVKKSTITNIQKEYFGNLPIYKMSDHRQLFEHFQNIIRYSTFNVTNFTLISSNPSFTQTQYSLFWMLTPTNKFKTLQKLFQFVKNSRWIKINQTEIIYLKQLYQSLSKMCLKEAESTLIRQYCSTRCFHSILNIGLRNLTDPSHLSYLRLLTSILYSFVQRRFREKNFKQFKQLYRGFKLSEREESFLKNNIGKYMQLQGFISTSISKDIAQKFHRDLMIIEVDIQQIVRREPSPLGGFAPIYKNQSFYNQQQQILFNPLNCFKIKSFDQSNGKKIVTLEYVSHLIDYNSQVNSQDKQMNNLIRFYQMQLAEQTRIKTPQDIFMNVGKYDIVKKLTLENLKRKLNNQNTDSNNHQVLSQLDPAKLENSKQILAYIGIQYCEQNFADYVCKLIEVGNTVPDYRRGFFHQLAFIQEGFLNYEMAIKLLDFQQIVNQNYKLNTLEQLQTSKSKTMLLQIMKCNVLLRARKFDQFQNLYKNIMRYYELYQKQRNELISQSMANYRNPNIEGSYGFNRGIQLSFIELKAKVHTQQYEFEQAYKSICKLQNYSYVNIFLLLESQNYTHAIKVLKRQIVINERQYGQLSIKTKQLYGSLADSYYCNRQYQKALTLYDKIYEINKSYNISKFNLKINMKKGLLYLKWGQYQKGFELIESYINSIRDEQSAFSVYYVFKAYIGLVEANLSLKSYDEAFQFLEKASQFAEQNPEHQIQIAKYRCKLLFMQQKKISLGKQLANLRQKFTPLIQQKSPKGIKYLLVLCQLYIELKMLPDAQIIATQAQQLHSNYYESYNKKRYGYDTLGRLMGRILQQKGKYKQAIQYYQSVIEFQYRYPNPHSHLKLELYLGLAQCYWKNKQNNKAVELMEKYQSLYKLLQIEEDPLFRELKSQSENNKK